MKSKGYLVPLKETKALSSLVYLADAFKRAGVCGFDKRKGYNLFTYRHPVKTC